MPEACFKPIPLIRLLLVPVILASGTLAYADRVLYDQHCGACHTLDASEPQRQGPFLGDVIGRTAGSVDGFSYSSGLKSLGIVWDADTLDQWITHPQQMATDSYMMYQQNDAAVRQQIIRFLGTL